MNKQQADTKPFGSSLVKKGHPFYRMKRKKQPDPKPFGNNPVNKGHPLYRMKRKQHVPTPERGTSEEIGVYFDKEWVVLTPINTLAPQTELGVCAKADYIQEEKKFMSGADFPMWDDPDPKRRAGAEIGDLFGFVHNQVARGKDLVEYFEVTGKKDTSERPAHWTIPAHQDRKVAVLSRYIGWTSFTDLSVALGRRKSPEEGKNCLRGTERLPWPKSLQVFME